MKFSLALLIFISVSCQDYNSNTFDRDQYAEIELIGGAQFEASYKILQTRCMSCHEHASWSKYTNQQNWVDQGLVIPNDPDNSRLINRIINYGGASSDMPIVGGPLPSAEFDALKAWVQAL